MSASPPAVGGCTYGGAPPAGISDAVTVRQAGTRGNTRTVTVTRSSRALSPARSGFTTSARTGCRPRSRSHRPFRIRPTSPYRVRGDAFRTTGKRGSMVNPGHPHQPPSSWLGEMIKCSCGHGIGKHSGAKCEGDIRGRCDCRLSALAVLEAATSAARRGTFSHSPDPARAASVDA